jgi:copper transport protein
MSEHGVQPPLVADVQSALHKLLTGEHGCEQERERRETDRGRSSTTPASLDNSRPRGEQRECYERARERDQDLACEFQIAVALAYEGIAGATSVRGEIAQLVNGKRREREQSCAWEARGPPLQGQHGEVILIKVTRATIALMREGVAALRHLMTPPKLKSLIVLTAVCLLALPPEARAHAVLQDTSPARGTTLEKQPDVIGFSFSEPVEGSFGAVRVFDSAGKQVQSGDVLRPQGQKSIGVRLRSGLREGSYTATFRVLSADSHPVSGGFVFSVGRPSSPSQTVAQLTSGGDTGHVTQVGYGIARGVTYAATGLAIGALIFILLVWLPGLRSVAGGDARWREASERFAARMRMLLAIALTAGAFGEAAQIMFQGATGAGTSFWGALDTEIVREVLDTRFGTVHLLAGGAFLGGLILVTARGWVPVLRPASLGAAGLAMGRALTRFEIGITAVLFGFLAVAPALAGHASTQSPTGLLVPTDVLHVVAMSVWVGGLVALVVVLPAATRALEPSDRTRLLAAALLRFSPLALAALCALIATGLVQSYAHVRSLDNLIHTGFGRAVLIKFCILLALIAFGAWNRQRGLPRLKQLVAEGESLGHRQLGTALRRSLRSEVALLAVVLGVTATLVSYAPPVAIGGGSGPFSATEQLGPLELQMTVDPASAGRNVMHLYLINARDGSQFNGTKELKVLLRLPDEGIGPIKPKAQKAGPGHYVIPALDFVPAGDWEVELVDRVSDFDQYETKVKVPIK